MWSNYTRRIYERMTIHYRMEINPATITARSDKIWELISINCYLVTIHEKLVG